MKKFTLTSLSITGIFSLILVIGIQSIYSQGEEKKSLLDYAKDSFNKMDNLCLKYNELDAIDEIKTKEFKNYCEERIDDLLLSSSLLNNNNEEDN